MPLGVSISGNGKTHQAFHPAAMSLGNQKIGHLPAETWINAEPMIREKGETALFRIFSILDRTASHGSFVSSGKVPRYLLVSVLLLMILGCPNSREERRLFLEGRELVVMGRYEEAVFVVERYLSAYPRGKYASRAYLFLGKAYLGQLKLDDAARVFDDGSRRFPETLEGHKCRYKRAVVDLLRGDSAAARGCFAKLADNPDGPLAPEARAFERYLED